MDSLPSPVHSALSSPPPSNTLTSCYHTLPHPRSSGPLKAGSRPESNLIAYLDSQLLQVSRKYAKKFNDGGYITITAIVEDLERLVDAPCRLSEGKKFIKFSLLIVPEHKATLQIHYLLQMANSFNDYLASFPPRLKPTLRLLDTFDRCFYTLITGLSVDLSTPLSPALLVYRMNMTEKVRLKSLIERTRLHVVKLVEGKIGAPDPPIESVMDIGERDEDQMEVEVETETDVDADEYLIENEELEIEVSKVYDRCMVQLGEGLRIN